MVSWNRQTRKGGDLKFPREIEHFPNNLLRKFKFLIFFLSLFVVEPPATAYAQGPTTAEHGRQMVKDGEPMADEEFQSEVKRLFDLQSLTVRKIREELGDTAIGLLEEMEKSVAETEKVLGDPRFLRGLLKIREWGVVDLESFIANPNLEPQLIMDEVELNKRLEQIPSSLRGKITLTPRDLVSGDAEYKRQRSLAPLSKMAEIFGTGPSKPTITLLLEIIELEKVTPHVVQALAEINSASMDNANLEWVRFVCEYQDFICPAFAESQFTEDVVALIKGGIDASELFPERLRQSDWNIQRERISDPNFREVLTTLAHEELVPSLFPVMSVFALDPSIYGNHNFVTNAINLGKYSWGGISQIGANRVSRALTLPPKELSSILDRGSDDNRFDMLNFIESILRGSEWQADKDVWKQALALSQRYKNIFKIGGERFADLQYRDMIAQHLAGETEDEESDLTSVRRAVDEEFVFQVTGETIDTHIDSLPSYLEIIEAQETHPVVALILREYRDAAFKTLLSHMAMEEVPSRLELIRNLDAEILFEALWRADKNTPPDVISQLYNGGKDASGQTVGSFIEKVRETKFLSASAFIKSAAIEPDGFPNLIVRLSEARLLVQFLRDLGDQGEVADILADLLLRTILDGKLTPTGEQALRNLWEVTDNPLKELLGRVLMETTRRDRR